EILSGRTRDANLAFLGRRLNELGIRLREVRVVADDEDAIVAAVNACRAAFDYVFTTGGIGPTHDDITAAAIAKAFGQKLIRNPAAVEILLASYARSGLEVNEARLSMADTPEHASLIENPVSGAPGFRLENVFVFAGVPKIMQAMFDGMTHLLTGGEPVLHPACREITQLLAQHTQARRVTLMSNGTAPAELESICATILEEGIPGVLDVVISLDGLEETHNCIRGNPDAWHLANYSLGLLTHLKARNPGRFDLGVLTIISDKNHKEIEPLNDHIERNFGCRHGFEFIRGSSFSVWNLPDEVRAQYDGAGSSLPPQDAWDEILETLQRISRRSGIANHADHLTSLFTVQMLRTGKKMVECVSAGQNVGVLYGNGEVAHCEFSKPFGSIRDHAMDFGQTWTSKEADEMRDRLHGCHCTHGCYLSKNIEYSLRGQLAMLTRL
ncbi:hypothetical protein IIC65_08220, partial [Candidatus Sumerlaeota bacterium]|nr:hypothetical protein [Candidatus Sumerlaeota bacterium]